MYSFRSVAVYCGASDSALPIYKAAAKEMGEILAQNQLTLIYGGGRVGLMGIVADSALAAGGQVMGIITRHLYHYEAAHEGVTELRIVESMHERKQRMFTEADTILIMPGGFGTLDEAFEIITWKQIHLHKKPIVILNCHQYWSLLFDQFVNHMIQSGLMNPLPPDFYQLVDTPDEVLAAFEGQNKKVTNWDI